MLTDKKEATTADDSIKNRRAVRETPLAQFVRARLQELGMKQAEFCRITGFDQGLLSKIHSSMISNLNLETALRLANGLSVPPGKILELIGRLDLHALILDTYPAVQEPTGATPDIKTREEAPLEVVEISQLALAAHEMGVDLHTVGDRLREMVKQASESPTPSEPDDNRQDRLTQ